MKAGEFEEGTHILRAKIDMEDPNMLMRDPIMYRILYKHIIEQEMIGVFTQCTIGRMVKVII